jgi:hypothetical protein
MAARMKNGNGRMMITASIATLFHQRARTSFRRGCGCDVHGVDFGRGLECVTGLNSGLFVFLNFELFTGPYLELFQGLNFEPFTGLSLYGLNFSEESSEQAEFVRLRIKFDE